MLSLYNEALLCHNYKRLVAYVAGELCFFEDCNYVLVRYSTYPITSPNNRPAIAIVNSLQVVDILIIIFFLERQLCCLFAFDCYLRIAFCFIDLFQLFDVWVSQLLGDCIFGEFEGGSCFNNFPCCPSFLDSFDHGGLFRLLNRVDWCSGQLDLVKNSGKQI